MSFEEQGFLSEDIATIRKEIRERYALYFRMVDRVNSLCQRAIAEVSVYSHDGQQVIATSLMIKLLNDAEGSILLVERGLESQARSLLRVAIEALFILWNLCQDEHFFRAYVYRSEIERLTLVRALLKNPARMFDDVRPHLTPDLADKITKEIKEAGVTKEMAEQLAKGVGLGHMYDGFYRLLSQDIHSSPRALERYIIADDEEEFKGLRYGPMTGDIILILTTAAMVMLMAIGAINQLLGLNIDAEIRQLDEELRTLVEKPPGGEVTDRAGNI